MPIFSVFLSKMHQAQQSHLITPSLLELCGRTKCDICFDILSQQPRSELLACRANWKMINRVPEDLALRSRNGKLGDDLPLTVTCPDAGVAQRCHPNNALGNEEADVSAGEL
jgi:hypothetical protein